MVSSRIDDMILMRSRPALWSMHPGARGMGHEPRGMGAPTSLQVGQGTSLEGSSTLVQACGEVARGARSQGMEGAVATALLA